MATQIQQQDIPAFTGGLNKETRPDLLDMTQLQESINYEHLGDGNLTKRTAPEQYDANLDSLLASQFATSVITISEPFFPPRDVTGQYNDFLLFVFGNDGGTYKMIAAYQDGATSWAADSLSGLTSAGISYTSESDPRFVVAERKVIITDGVNKAHFVAVDEDNAIVSGILGISAPLNKLTMTEIDAFNASDWETDSTADYISVPGLFQATYTVVDKYGNESNPAPLSDTRNMQWFQLSTSDPVGEDERWIDRVQISNLSVPADLSSDVLESLESFNVYIRTIRFSEGDTPESFEYSQQFEIIDKDNNSGTTGNTYTITLAPDVGNTVSYDNDVAPIADYGAHIGGVTLLGSLQTQVEFPFDFDYYVPITINNVNTKTFVDAIIRIRLWDANSGETDAITSLDWTAYDTNADDQIETALNNLRFYDQDLTTALSVVYDMDTSENWLDAYIKIPQLPTAQSYTVYLTFGTTADGVDDANLQTFATGKWFSLDNDTWANQEVFHNLRVRDSDDFISSPAEYPFNTQIGVRNFANTNYDGVLASATVLNSPSSSIATLAFADKTLGAGKLKLSAYNERFYFDYTDGDVPAQGYFASYMEFTASDMVTGQTTGDDFIVWQITEDANNYFKLLLFYNGTDWEWRLVSKESGGAEKSHSFNTTVETFGTGSDKIYYVVLSWDFPEDRASLFIVDIGGGANHGETYFEEKTSFGFDTQGGQYTAAEISYGDIADGLKSATYDQFSFNINRYLSADSLSDLSAVVDMCNFAPLAETLVGYQFANTDVIVNGDFSTDSDWTKGTGWTIGGGTASCDGTQTTVTDLTAAVDPLESGQYVQVQFTISNYSAGNVFFICGASANGTFRSANGTYIERVFCDGTGFKIRGDADFVGDIDNVKAWPDSHNNNITFGDTETSDLKTRKNALRWTTAGGTSFSELRDREVNEPIMALLDAPSFLQFQYENTALIYTRNTITRMVLSGDANSWATNPSSLIKEKTNYGLWAKDTLAKHGELLLWLSEAGLIQWSPQGLALVSHKIIDLPNEISDPANVLGFICPVRNQYILHDKGF